MKRRYEMPDRPHGRPGYYYTSGADGAWLRGSDGLDLRLAAPERASEIQRERLSMLGVMLAFLASREQPR